MRYGKAGYDIHKKPEGSILTIDFILNGQSFVALNGGPVYKINESISFYVYCNNENRLKFLFDKFSEGGEILMPLGEYEWSRLYVWLKDKFGVSWQLDINDINSNQKIVPTLLFTNEKSILVGDAVNFYTALFPNSKIITLVPFDKSLSVLAEKLQFAQFSLDGYIINAISGGNVFHKFDFNEAFSFILRCETQDEIDYYWDKLTEGGEEVECGWLKDKFGLSWQIVPTILNELFKDPKKFEKLMESLLKMKKIEINRLTEQIEI